MLYNGPCLPVCLGATALLLSDRLIEIEDSKTWSDRQENPNYW